MAKGKIDYDRIEPGWRAGILSPAQLASIYEQETGQSVTRVAICKHFEKLGIERDLTAKIRAKADALVAAKTVSPEVAKETAATERQIVEANAQVQATIRNEHRTDIQRSKRIANKLMGALEDLKLPAPPEATEDAAKLKAHAEEMTDVLKTQAGILKQLVDTQRVVVAMEREAFGIAQMVEAPEEQATTNHAEGLRRLAYLLYSAGKAPAQPAKEAAHG